MVTRAGGGKPELLDLPDHIDSTMESTASVSTRQSAHFRLGTIDFRDTVAAKEHMAFQDHTSIVVTVPWQYARSCAIGGCDSITMSLRQYWGGSMRSRISPREAV
jgi:hypothetical protein